MKCVECGRELFGADAYCWTCAEYAETPSEPAAELLAPVKVVSREELRKQYEHDPYCYLDGKPCVECKAADEARDHFAAHYVIKRGDGNMHYADAVKSGWNAAIEFVKGGNKNGK